MSEPMIKSAPQMSADKIWTKDFTLILLANFFIFLCFQMTVPTIPLFVKELGGNDQLVGLVVGIFTFSSLLLRPHAGQTIETKGRRFVYLLGLVLFVVSIASFGFVKSLLFLFFLRIVQGVGWGYSTTASGTIITDIIPPKRRGEGMGIYGLSSSLALALGPTLGLAFVGFLTFPQIFLVCAVLGFVAFFLSLNIHYRKMETNSAQLGKRGIYEKSALPPSILLFFITLTFGGISSFLPIYSQEKGIDGILMYFFLYAIALMVSRPFTGKLYDRKGHKAVFIPGALLIIISMSLLAWLPNSLTLYIAAVLYGFGFGTVQPALQAWSVKDVPSHRRGMANATFLTFFDLGVGIGAILFGQIAYWFGYSTIYVIAGISVLLSVGIYLGMIWRNKITI
ncbi:MFS transporter [Bacillus sp. S/N-304-OC-R1]|uniref:MFS transporter n=1 Tax=Bacillus sp. S/N-304-OC-R1 TaxID=2758034 RepID=UPI001C8E4701|nr:MFS transporter [Bacillus sp. S/N-304-OC-R1]MBY0121675.1 MFS transporter [Bacillus sp. S/N-304-OC-R1]